MNTNLKLRQAVAAAGLAITLVGTVGVPSFAATAKSSKTQAASAKSKVKKSTAKKSSNKKATTKKVAVVPAA